MLWFVVGLGVLAVVLAASGSSPSGTPLDPAGTGPGGTKALVELLGESGAEVSVGPQVPTSTDGVALLLADTTSAAMTDDLTAWVEAGGTLVVTDPRSSFTPSGTPVPTAFGLGQTTLGRGRCTIAALDGLDRVAPGDGSVVFDVPEDATACVDAGKGSFVVDEPVGDGHLVTVGGAGAFTNELLGSHDNAVLAVDLLAPRPGAPVRVLWGMTGPAGGEQLGDLISTGVKLALWELVVVFVVFALWRGRRLGRPVAEPQLVQVGGSELVSAVGHLLARSRDPDRAARLLRADLRRQLAARLGLGPGVAPEVLADVAAARTGLDRDRVAEAVTDAAVRSDDELLTLAHDIDTIRTEVLHDRHA